jgi:DNA-binding CsgD family transcriptional regulator/tetratricopeptide (TPR) repeat protein
MAVRGTSPQFIGRADELATLDRLLDGDDRLRLVLVGGEAGIGKSRLIAEWGRRARGRGALLLVGGAVDIAETGALPYVAIVEALRPLTEDPGRALLASAGPIGPDLARLLPSLGPTPISRAPLGGLPEEFAQLRLFEQLLGLLTRLATRQPTVLALEDLQWAEQSTRDLLVYLAHNVGDAPISLIGSFRSDELPPLHPMRAVLGQLIREPRTARLDLLPFGPEEHAAHVAQLLGTTPPPGLLRATYARSEGNPFFTEELLAASDPDAARLPDSLRDALLVRLRGISPAAREVVRVISVGWSVPHPLLASVARLDEPVLMAALREAVDGALLVPDPATGRYGLRHPLLAEAMLADLLPAERSRLHRAFAEALEAEPELGDASPARAAAVLANHWYAAGVMRKALPALVAAADEARGVHAQGESLAHLVRASEIADRLRDAEAVMPIQRWELDSRTALAAEAIGDFERAIDAWHRALEHAADATNAVRADLLVHLGETEFLAGSLDRFVAARRAAVELVPAEPPTPLRALVLAKLAIALSLASQLAEARPMAEEALAVARRVGTRAEEGKALSTLGTVLYLSGASEVAIEHLRAGLEISQELGRLGDEAIDRSNLSEALHQAGRPREGLAVVLEGLGRARANGLERTYGETMTAIAVNWLFLLGRWDEAGRLGAEALERAPRGLAGDWTAMALAELEISQGRFDEASAHLDRVLGGDRTARAPGWYGPHEQRAHLLLELDRPAEAMGEVRAALRALDRIGIAPESGEIGWLALRGLQAATEEATAARAHGDAEALARADALVADLVTRFEAHLAAVRGLAGTLDRHTAVDAMLVAAEQSRYRREPDPTLWARAADGYAAMDHPWDEIGARWRQAEALLLAGRPRSEAAGPLRAAHAGAVALGALPTVARIEALAHRARITLDATLTQGRGHRADGNGRRPAKHLVARLPQPIERLTPREREVLALLAGGRTNREIAAALFISDKTASVHVMHIKEKLGTRTRVEAAALAIRLGVAEPTVEG